MGVWSESVSLSSWKGSIQAGRGWARGAGRLLEGQVPSRSLSFIAQHLASHFQMLPGRLALHSGSDSQRLMRARGVPSPHKGSCDAETKEAGV